MCVAAALTPAYVPNRHNAYLYAVPRDGNSSGNGGSSRRSVACRTFHPPPFLELAIFFISHPAPPPSGDFNARMKRMKMKWGESQPIKETKPQVLFHDIICATLSRGVVEWVPFYEMTILRNSPKTNVCPSFFSTCKLIKVSLHGQEERYNGVRLHGYVLLIVINIY